MWLQKEIILSEKPRGFHLITSEVLEQSPEMERCRVGLAHLFIKHTSASISINENADPDVRYDLESYFNQIAPENQSYFKHVLEGSDDMPAHLKSVMIGCSLTMPVTNGRLAMGIWQGIYLCEHRDCGGQRHLILTLNGQGD